MHCMRSQWKTRRIEIAISLQLFFLLLHDHDFSDPAYLLLYLKILLLHVGEIKHTR